jgi:hypothetical protein
MRAMKFDELRSIGHNIADSLASGIGLLVGVYETDVFGEARRSPERCVVVDFLSSKVIGGRASRSLSRAIALYAKALPALCQKHRTSSALLRELTARYSVDAYGPRFVVTVEDDKGRRVVDEYIGIPGRRIRLVDHLAGTSQARSRCTSATCHDCFWHGTAEVKYCNQVRLLDCMLHSPQTTPIHRHADRN